LLLVSRVGAGVLLAFLAGQANEYLTRSAPAYSSIIRIAIALALCAALYPLVVKPLIRFADCQREAKSRK
jgi:hypothetical protein